MLMVYVIWHEQAEVTDSAGNDGHLQNFFSQCLPRLPSMKEKGPQFKALQFTVVGWCWMVLDEVKGESIARHLLDQGAVWANSGREVAEQCPSAASHGPSDAMAFMALAVR